MDWPGFLIGPCQTIYVVEDLSPLGVQLEVQLPARPEFEEEEKQAPPEEELLVVGDEGRKTRVGQFVEPTVEIGEEMKDGPGEGGADVQTRPALRL
jgi:hypothetical protein